MGNPEGKRPLGRPKRIWVDNFKIDLREGGVVWTEFLGLRIEGSGGLL
jgi:hypothetical protein